MIHFYVYRPVRQPSAHGRTTDMSNLTTAAIIAEKFGELFKNEWKEAMDELEQFKTSELNVAICLFRIVNVG